MIKCQQNEAEFSKDLTDIIELLKQIAKKVDASNWELESEYSIIKKGLNSSLSKFDLESVSKAISMLRPKAENGERVAAVLLSLIGGNKAVSSLIAYTLCFDNEDGEHAEIAEEMEFIFSQMSKDVVIELIDALNNATKGNSEARGNTEVTRRSIAGALGEIADESAIEILIKTLKLENSGEDYVTAQNCIYSLSVFEDARAAKAIVDALEHGDGDVERVARNMLRYNLIKGSFNKEPIRCEAINSMIDFLQSEDNSVIMNSASVLGDICAERAIEPIEEIISSRQELPPGVSDYLEKTLTKIHAGNIYIEGEI